MTTDERKQLELIAAAENALSSSIINLAGAAGLEHDHVRRTSLELIEKKLREQQKRIEQFSRRLHRKLREDHERPE